MQYQFRSFINVDGFMSFHKHYFDKQCCCFVMTLRNFKREMLLPVPNHPH